jgi:2-polyprenyl-6-methoxyphenol hydroxylase-like FAD-dependent oxidoreductase
MRVLIIGGGIGGLTTALSLHTAGMDCAVYESINSLRALGVGINLQPNAVRELTELGLGDALAATAIETSTLAYHNKHGHLIWSEPRGLKAGYKWLLLMILLDAAGVRLGSDNIHTGHHFVHFDQTGGGVTANFVDRATRSALPSARGDVQIGADGIHSAVRQQLYPDEGPPASLHWRSLPPPIQLIRCGIMKGSDCR